MGSSRELNQAGDLFNLNHGLRGSTTPQVYRTHLIFLSATAAMLVFFLNWEHVYWSGLPFKLVQSVNIEVLLKKNLLTH